MVWRVGSGEQIWIWEDSWLPTGAVGFPRSRRGNTLLTRVSELIDPLYHAWIPNLSDRLSTMRKRR